MAENLFNKAHKATNPIFRQRYDEIDWGYFLIAKDGIYEIKGNKKKKISKPIVDFREKYD